MERDRDHLVLGPQAGESGVVPRRRERSGDALRVLEEDRRAGFALAQRPHHPVEVGRAERTRAERAGWSTTPAMPLIALPRGLRGSVRGLAAGAAAEAAR